MKAFFLSLLAVTGLFGQAHIRADDGASITSSTGWGQASGMLGIPEAYVDYDVADVSGTNGVKEATWANSGTAGSGWDMLGNVGGGLIYRSSGNCTYGDGPCMEADGASALLDTSANVTTWSATVMCATFYKDDPVATVDYLHWSNNFVSQGLLKEFSTQSALITNGGNDYFVGSNETGMNAFCWDMSDVTAVTIAVNGGAPEGPTDFTAGTFRLPTHMAVGSNYTGVNFCTGCEFHRILIYNEDPGIGIQELSRRLYMEYKVP